VDMLKWLNSLSLLPIIVEISIIILLIVAYIGNNIISCKRKKGCFDDLPDFIYLKL